MDRTTASKTDHQQHSLISQLVTGADLIPVPVPMPATVPAAITRFFLGYCHDALS
jgi:hypothetical protein